MHTLSPLIKKPEIVINEATKIPFKDEIFRNFFLIEVSTPTNFKNNDTLCWMVLKIKK